MMALAVVGPTPGSSSSSFADARLMSIGCDGGFLLAKAERARLKNRTAVKFVNIALVLRVIYTANWFYLVNVGQNDD